MACAALAALWLAVLVFCTLCFALDSAKCRVFTGARHCTTCRTAAKLQNCVGPRFWVAFEVLSFLGQKIAGCIVSIVPCNRDNMQLFWNGPQRDSCKTYLFQVSRYFKICQKKKVCRGFCNDLWQVCGYYMLIWLICIFSWFLLQIRVWELWKCKNADATTHISEWLRRPRRLRVCQWFTDQIISGIFQFFVEFSRWKCSDGRSGRIPTFDEVEAGDVRSLKATEGHWRPLKAWSIKIEIDRRNMKEGYFFF